MRRWRTFAANWTSYTTWETAATSARGVFTAAARRSGAEFDVPMAWVYIADDDGLMRPLRGPFRKGEGARVVGA